MGPTNNVMLAGAFKNMGDSWVTTLLDWTAKGLMIALVLICLVQVVRKMSIKAGIGAVIGLVICWAIFSGRYQLSSMFGSEFKDPGTQQTSPIDLQGAPALPKVFTGQL